MSLEPVFAELYETHYRRVFGLCRQLLGSTVQAEDAASEVFMRAYRAFDRYDASQPFARWILTMASNYCIDLVRRRKHEAVLFGDELEERLACETDEADVLGTLETQERAHEINAAIAALPERYRLPLVLAYYRDATYDEIATELDITRSHAGVLICRAKQALRRALTARAEETES